MQIKIYCVFILYNEKSLVYYNELKILFFLKYSKINNYVIAYKNILYI
jgi:hypothetical protein